MRSCQCPPPPPRRVNSFFLTASLQYTQLELASSSVSSSMLASWGARRQLYLQQVVPAAELRSHAHLPPELLARGHRVHRVYYRISVQGPAFPWLQVRSSCVQCARIGAVHALPLCDGAHRGSQPHSPALGVVCFNCRVSCLSHDPTCHAVQSQVLGRDDKQLILLSQITPQLKGLFLFGSQAVSGNARPPASGISLGEGTLILCGLGQ
jgi:hypothetical protein